jgi:hypothetical protein
LIHPINNFFHSQFKQVDIKLNDRSVSSALPSYPYRAMFETLLNYGNESKTTHLQSELFYKDKAGNMDKVTTSASPVVCDNPAALTRRSFFISKNCECYGRIHADIFHVNKFLKNKVNIGITLHKADDKFALMGTEADCSFHIEQAIFYVKKVRISNDILIAHAMVLEKMNMIYPITAVNVTTHTINPGLDSKIFENIIQGILPKRIVIGFVDAGAENGDLTKNPFNFKHFSITNLELVVDGVSSASKFELDYGNQNYLRAYNTLYSGIDSNEGNDLTITDYIGGYNLYVFNLAPDG